MVFLLESSASALWQLRTLSPALASSYLGPDGPAQKTKLWSQPGDEVGSFTLAPRGGDAGGTFRQGFQEVIRRTELQSGGRWD